MIQDRARRVILAAIGIYCLWSVLLIFQKPGLQYDEAFLVAGAVHMLHPNGEYKLSQAPDIWVCPLDHCLALMGSGQSYVGAVKDYLALPLFALFGPRASVIRFLSMLLGALGIWGIAKLLADCVSGSAGAAVAMILALNPSYTAMTVFDNNAFPALMAALGLVCLSFGRYARSRRVANAFLLGITVGLAVWARANVVWIFAAAGIAALIVYGRRLSAPAGHFAAFAGGGLVGGFPFLVYQVVSGGGTWRAQESFSSPLLFAQLLRYRSHMLEETLLSDVEHQRMWGHNGIPQWQMLLFPSVVILALVVCLAGFPPGQNPVRRKQARFAGLTCALLTGYMFVTQLNIAEHHQIMLLPIMAVVVVLAYTALYGVQRALSIGVAALALVYVGSSVYWQIAAVRGLRETRGVGMWSDGVFNLARRVDQDYRCKEIQILDWGLQANLFVLTEGRMQSVEAYSDQSADRDRWNHSWLREIQAGGVFLVNGPDNRDHPQSSAGFLEALASARAAPMKRMPVFQHDGVEYAELIAVGSENAGSSPCAAALLPSSISMGDAQAEGQLAGFYQIEYGAWRWTAREFAVRLGAPHSANGAQLAVQFFVPDTLIQKLGAITVRARVDGHPLKSDTYSQPGEYVFRRDLPAAWLGQAQVQVNFTLDKVLAPPPPDRRELGIIVRHAALAPK